jgi:hypothetical protein
MPGCEDQYRIPHRPRGRVELNIRHWTGWCPCPRSWPVGISLADNDEENIIRREIDRVAVSIGQPLRASRPNDVEAVFQRVFLNLDREQRNAALSVAVDTVL